MNTLFDIYQNAFIDHSTDNKSLDYFKRSGTYIPPEICPSATTLELRNSNGSKVIDEVDKSMAVIPLKLVLKKFLELPNVLNSILLYMKKVKSSDLLESTIQGELFIEISKNFGSKLVLPLILFIDDFEINNVLGTHKVIRKIGAVYCTIACTPPEYASQLENIFLAQFHRTKDHNDMGNRFTFSKIIEQLKELETNGIDVNTENYKGKVYFVLLSVCGDNLGANEILGFPESFNVDYCCRDGFADKATMKTQCNENIDLLRTPENYIKHLETNAYGIEEECVFNSIPSYNVVLNGSFHEMHDIPEGVIRYDLAKIIKSLMKIKCFTLQILHERIRYFDFGFQNSENKPPPLKPSGVQKEYIIYSASEMMLFLNYFGLLIDDLVKEDNEHWKLYVLLRQIVCLIRAPTFSKNCASLLNDLIFQHHTLYI